MSNEVDVTALNDWININLTSIETISHFLVLSLGNSTEEQYYKYQVTYVIAISFSVGLLILATIVGNVFVMAAILTERSLKIVQNYLILSLALTDLLVAVLVMPLSLLNEVSTRWTYGHVVCDLWTSMDILCCTASILHLVAISGDRYLAVSNVDYIRKRNETRIVSMIVIVWAVSALISIPPLFGWRDALNSPEITGRCVISQDLAYTVFSTVFAFYLPLIFMIILNFKIYNIAKSRIRKRRFHKASNSQTRKSSDTVGPSTHFRECSTACPAEKGDQQMTYINGNEITVLASAHESHNSDRHSNSVKWTPPEVASDEVVQIKPDEAKVNYTVTKSVTFTFNHSVKNNHHRDKMRRERLEMKRERRAAKVLAIITSAFVVCWLPFFIIALVAPFCNLSCTFPGPVLSFFLWLGYVNSLVNPIIYTIFNPHFRKAFNKILFVRFLKRSKQLR